MAGGQQLRHQQPALVAVRRGDQDHGRAPRPDRSPRSRPRGSTGWPRCRDVGSAPSSTRSARSPGAIRPRSSSPKWAAADGGRRAQRLDRGEPGVDQQRQLVVQARPERRRRRRRGRRVGVGSREDRHARRVQRAPPTPGPTRSSGRDGRPSRAGPTIAFIIVSVGTSTAPRSASSVAVDRRRRAVQRDVGEHVDSGPLRPSSPRRAGTRARPRAGSCVGRRDERVDGLLVETGQVDDDLDVVGALRDARGRRRPRHPRHRRRCASAARRDVASSAGVRAGRRGRRHHRSCGCR